MSPLGSIESSLREVRLRIEKSVIASGRKISDVTLLAVSKGFSIEHVSEAIRCGQVAFAENKVQEVKQKFPSRGAFGLPVRCDFVGHLQRNKASLAVALCDLIHTVDRVELAQALAKASADLGKTQPVLLQVNISRENSKRGVIPEHSLDLCRLLVELPELRLDGLMCIGTSPQEDPERIKAKAEFAEMAYLRDEIQSRLSRPMPELSMGMSEDLELAISAGATLLRVGSAIFGER